jgi:hypothetical protein
MLQNQMWFDQAKSSISASPISYEHNTCQLILFRASGEKVIPFSKKIMGMY